MKNNICQKHLVFVFGMFYLPFMGNCVAPTAIKNESNLNNSASVNKSFPSPVISKTFSQNDEINDVVDGDGRKSPLKLDSIDLTSVELELTDSDIKVTFETNDSIPTSLPSGKTALWQVQAWSQDKNQGYYLGAKLVESKWQVFIFNITTETNIYVEKPSTSGKKLVANFPFKQLSNLGQSFTWSATAEYDGKWSDKIPNQGELSFPTS